jgi:type IV secretion system protein VirD4
VQRLLRRSSEPSYEADALQFLTTNERTRSSICATVMPALGWLTDPNAASAARVGDFDVARLLDERGTVYMLGAEDAQTAPLVTALTGHIAREARRLSAEQPAGRLDPPLTLALDEAALICPVPLDKWTADMGGRNITLHIAAQSRAQLRQRFGDAGAAAIVNNTATLLIFGGTRDPDDLAAYATLAGERDEDVPTYDHTHGQTSTTTRRVPVLSAAQIAQLPTGRVMIVSRGMPVAIGTVQMAWRRHDVRRTARRLQVADHAPALEPAEPIGEVVGVITPADDAAA